MILRKPYLKLETLNYFLFYVSYSLNFFNEAVPLGILNLKLETIFPIFAVQTALSPPG